MRGRVIAAAISLAAASTAHAAPLRYLCDAPFGKSSEFWQERDGPAFTVSGEIRVDALYDILPQPPGEALRIIGPVPDTRGGSVQLEDLENSVFFHLGVGPHERSSEMLEVVVQWQVGDEVRDRQLALLPKRNYQFERVPFTIATDGRQVTVEAAGARTEIPVALGPGVVLRVACSGGEFFFNDLDWSG